MNTLSRIIIILFLPLYIIDTLILMTDRNSKVTFVESKSSVVKSWNSKIKGNNFDRYC